MLSGRIIKKGAVVYPTATKTIGIRIKVTIEFETVYGRGAPKRGYPISMQIWLFFVILIFSILYIFCEFIPSF